MHEHDAQSSEGSLTQRLARLFGPQVDPHISLTPLPESQPVGEVVAELLRGAGTPQRYEVQREIDRGGMGAVLEVWDRELRRPLAMKVALPGSGEAASDRRRVARFLEEAQITAQLDHPGVVPVHELGLTEEGQVFFTMRRVEGRDLREVLHCVHYGLDGWNETRALSVLLRACEAVAFAHSRGVIHRDLKPANIMVGAFGEVYVMDWGLARVLGREPQADCQAPLSTVLGDQRELSPVSPLVTTDGDVLGTPAYMAPEQARGELGELSPRTDVYALGAMLYHLLAHEPPYFPAGRPTTQVEALQALLRGPPRPLAQVRDRIPPELVAICERAMAADPAARYADVQALAGDLRAYLELRVVSAHEAGAWAEMRKWVRRNRPLAAALGVAVLTLVVGLVATATQYVRAERSIVQERAAAARADLEADAARASEAHARAETEKVLRLSDAKRLQQLQLEAQTLWPALPERAPALRAWIERALDLLAKLDLHRETLAQLRAGALPYDAEARRRDRDSHPQAAELDAARAEMAGLLEAAERLAGDAQMRVEERIAELEQRALELEDTLGVRRTWRFEDAERQWQHDVLAALVADLERLDGPDPLVSALADVRARLGFAESIAARSTSGPAAAALWAEASAAVAANPLYGGLALTPQVGLLPLGPDPDSGLWEFAHLASGEPAQRRRDGRLWITEATGVVLVLLPAGRFLMGGQAQDPGAPCYDPWAGPEELPVHEVELAAFLIAKHELTQAQWLRATGSNPSVYGPHNYGAGWNRERRPASLLHPVEQVSWTDCERVLSQLDLTLPTEAQWEYAARAGTTSVWWTGDGVESLQGATNLADRFAQENAAAGWPAYEPSLDDGHTCHAPVGSYRPNAFGLHDTAGNVYEWCADGYGTYSSTPRAGDGARASVVAQAHARRGGGWSLAAVDARSAARNPGAAAFVSDVLGVRAARALR